jgi:recombination protein RecT
MAKKTVVRKLFKYLPISIEKLQMATALDEEADLGTQNVSHILEGEEYTVDYATGEVIDTEVAQADALAEKLK